MCVFMCSYVEKYSLKEPSDDIQYVLKRIAVKLGKTQRVKALTGVGKGKPNPTDTSVTYTCTDWPSVNHLFTFLLS